MNWFKSILPLLIIVLFVSISNAQEQSYPDNIVIVLDTSGSMGYDMQGGQKINVAKQALKTVLSQVPEETNVGILTFHGWKFDLQPIGNRNKLFNAIDNIGVGGGTPLSDFMKHGADTLLKRRTDQLNYGNFTLLVVTDGEADNTRRVNKFASEIMSRGISLDVIGLAMNQDHSLKNASNSYRDGKDSKSLQEGLAEVFAEISPDESDSQEYYDVIAPLPDGVAAEILDALTTNVNYPIGESHKNRVKRTSSNNVGSAGNSGSTSVSTQQDDDGSFFVFIIILIIIMGGLSGAAGSTIGGRRY